MSGIGGGPGWLGMVGSGMFCTEHSVPYYLERGILEIAN